MGQAGSTDNDIYAPWVNSYTDGEGNGCQPPIDTIEHRSPPFHSSLPAASSLASLPVSASAPLESSQTLPMPCDVDINPNDAAQIELLRVQLVKISEIMERHERAAIIRQQALAAAAAEIAAAVHEAEPQHIHKKIRTNEAYPSSAASSSAALVSPPLWHVPDQLSRAPSAFESGFGLSAPLVTPHFPLLTPNHQPESIEGNQLFHTMRDAGANADMTHQTMPTIEPTDFDPTSFLAPDDHPTTLDDSPQPIEVDDPIGDQTNALLPLLPTSPPLESPSSPIESVLSLCLSPLLSPTNGDVDPFGPRSGRGVPTCRHMSKVFLANYLRSDVLTSLFRFLRTDIRRLRRSIASVTALLEEEESRELLDKFAQMTIDHPTANAVFDITRMNRSPVEPDDDDEDGVARFRYCTIIDTNTIGAKRKNETHRNEHDANMRLSSNDTHESLSSQSVPPSSSSSSSSSSALPLSDRLRFQSTFTVNRAFESLLGHTQSAIANLVDSARERTLFHYIRSDHTAALHRLIIRFVGDQNTWSGGKFFVVFLCRDGREVYCLTQLTHTQTFDPTGDGSISCGCLSLMPLPDDPSRPPPPFIEGVELEEEVIINGYTPIHEHIDTTQTEAPEQTPPQNGSDDVPHTSTTLTSSSSPTPTPLLPTIPTPPSPSPSSSLSTSSERH